MKDINDISDINPNSREFWLTLYDAMGLPHLGGLLYRFANENVVGKNVFPIMEGERINGLDDTDRLLVWTSITMAGLLAIAGYDYTREQAGSLTDEDSEKITIVARMLDEKVRLNPIPTMMAILEAGMLTFIKYNADIEAERFASDEFNMKMETLLRETTETSETVDLD